MFASILAFTASAGYPVLFLLITAESAGLPLPGETALITAAALAGQGKLSIPLVIGTAAAAAIIGDNFGYVLARKYRPGLLKRPGPFLTHRRRVLELGEPFFARHGAQAVFFGRWILGLRTWAAWLAGATSMGWRPFALWNATGAISWATTIGLAGYFIGQSTTGVFTLFGGLGLSITLLAAGILLARSRRENLPTPHPSPWSTSRSESRPRRDVGRAAEAAGPSRGDV
jgi:undecaprenyl-diphosphatase